MCVNIGKILGIPSSRKMKSYEQKAALPPIQKAAPPPPKAPPPPRLLQDPDEKPKVEFAKKKRAGGEKKKVGASDLRIPLNQEQSNAGSGGLNV